MRKGTFTNFPGDPGGDIHYWVADYKRCCGYKGVWLCDEPDHMLSLDKFSDDKYSQDGKQPMCKKCRVPMDAERWGRRPKHQVTGEGKSNWKQRVAKGLGGTPNTPEWQGFLDKAESLWDVEIKNHLLNTAPGEEVIAFIQSRKSEFGQSKPMTKRTITKVEGERVPEGWVYLVRNPDVPSILKIGKTFPDGIPDIMSSARRFGRAELIHKCWFSEAYRSEQSIHKVLRKYNLRVLGYTDCGKELFECSIDIAMSAILAECSDTEDAA